MEKSYHIHTWRLAEARPDLVQRTEPTAESPLVKVVRRRDSRPTRPIQRNELYLSHTSGVREAESAAILAGINKLINEIRSCINVKDFGAFRMHEGPYGNADWYQRQAITSRDMGYGNQVNYYTLNRLLSDEPHQQRHPHMDVFVVDRDLSTCRPDNNFIYGAASYPNYVMSVERLRHWISDTNLRHMALAVMAAHELGHNFGLVGRNFNWVNKLGSHCNGERGPCLMEQVDVGGSRTLEDQTMALLSNGERWLCKDCLAEAEFKKNHLERNGVVW